MAIDPAYNQGLVQTSGGFVMLSRCSIGLHITISVLIGVIYTDFVADHLQLLIVSMFPGGYRLFPQDCE